MKLFLIIRKDYQTGRLETNIIQPDRMVHYFAGIDPSWDVWMNSAAIGDHLNAGVIVAVRIC